MEAEQAEREREEKLQWKLENVIPAVSFINMFLAPHHLMVGHSSALQRVFIRLICQWFYIILFKKMTAANVSLNACGALMSIFNATTHSWLISRNGTP